MTLFAPISSFRAVLMLLALTFALVPAGASAQSDMRSFRVQFPPGATGTTLNDTIVGYQSVAYHLNARAGQTMDVSLSSSSTAVYFNIYAPGSGPGGQAMVVSDQTPQINVYRGRLPANGDYIISVYQVRSAARRNERASYSLNVSISGAGTVQRPPAATPPPPAGGPGQPTAAFWRVTGVRPGDPLNMRAGPSTRYEIVDRLPNGTMLRDRGCMTDQGGQRWCNVNRVGQPGRTGWVSARYLTPGNQPSGGGAAQLPGGAGQGFQPVTSDYWEVRTGGTALNVRSGPSTGFPVVTTAPNGTYFRNDGCQFSDGQIWCRVKPLGGGYWSGWAAGRYLVASNAPAVRPPVSGPPGDALVPGTGFNATGSIRCSYREGGGLWDCAFGVIRRGAGNAEVVVTLPNGISRNITFVGGVATSTNSQAGIYTERAGDVSNVFVGTTERYEIPDAVIYGG